MLWSDFNDANLHSMLKSEMLSWPVTMAILVLAFGALVAAGLPLTLTIAGLVASAGSLVLINEVTPVSIWAMNFAMMFSLALGIDYALLIVGRYRSVRMGKGKSQLEAVAETMDTAARLGAYVVGIDIAPKLVAAGNRRAARENLTNLRFIEGDADDLRDVADDTFDLTISIFGAMFAHNPDAVAREMVRVTRPGGHIVMGNWIPGDPTLVAQLLTVSAAYAPAPPAGFISPVTWGIEANVLARFGRAGIAADHIIAFPRNLHLRVHPAQLVDTFRRYYGPTMTAFDAATAAGRADDLRAELVELFERHNDGAHAPVTIPATYLVVRIALNN